MDILHKPKGEIISERTKQGLVAARASGQCLGRPKGAKKIKQEFWTHLKMKLKIS